MSASAERVERAPDLDLIEGARRFFQENPARILTVASGLRAPDRTIESTVLGVSMGRTVPEGSRIRIELGAPRRYDRGEVIAFVAAHHVVVHRVVCPARRWPQGLLLTRGDAELIPDPPVDADRVLGAVAAIQQDGRWVPVERRPWRSVRSCVLASVLLVLVGCALQASPRVAAALVKLLRRGPARLAAGLRRAGRMGAP